MIYIHIPYCHRKCHYCGFYSVAGRHDTEEYVDALCREMAMRCKGMSPRTIYIGGGTPTILSVAQVGRIVESLRRCCDLSRLEEFTMEGNPENLSESYLRDLASLGAVDRLSIGVQSFVDKELEAVGRVHSVEQAIHAVESAVKAGFGNLSVDLIMGLPGQTLESWRQSLATLATMGEWVKHLSCYELTVEPGTILEKRLGRGLVSLAGDDLLSAEYGMLMEWCDDNAMEVYEVSNFSRRGFRSRHNSRYWTREPYVGLGAGAHSFDGVRRRWNNADVTAYIDSARHGDVPHGEETLSPRDAFNEYVMTALRTVDGIDKRLIDKRFADALALHITPYVAEGMIVDEGTHYRPTREGMLHADGIAVSLFEL